MKPRLNHRDARRKKNRRQHEPVEYSNRVAPRLHIYYFLPLEVARENIKRRRIPVDNVLLVRAVYLSSHVAVGELLVSNRPSAPTIPIRHIVIRRRVRVVARRHRFVVAVARLAPQPRPDAVAERPRLRPRPRHLFDDIIPQAHKIKLKLIRLYTTSLHIVYSKFYIIIIRHIIIRHIIIRHIIMYHNYIP